MNVTRITNKGRIAACVLLLLCAVSFLSLAEPRAEVAQTTGLDPDLVNVVTVAVENTKLSITFVFINERTFDSRISARLAEILYPYVGQNAIYVNPSVDASVDTFDFDPRRLSIRQNGETVFPPPEAWVELTPGFSSGRFEVNPSGPEQGSGSEGVVVLGDLIDASQPFSVMYDGESATFDIRSAQTVPEPIEVAPLRTTDTVQDLLLSDDFSANAMAALLALDPVLVRTMTLTPSGGQELRLLFVRLADVVRTSLLGDELLDALDGVIGTGAIMVWAISPSGASFSPWNFYIRQNNTNYVFFSNASFVELTDGFLRIQYVPGGSVVAGVIRLPKGVDATAPFSVYYATTSVDYP
jgi:hypothetical protein